MGNGFITRASQAKFTPNQRPGPCMADHVNPLDPDGPARLCNTHVEAAKGFVRYEGGCCKLYCFDCTSEIVNSRP